MSENKILRENLKYQTEIESYKMRVESKEKEIEKLYQKILDQDSNYGITARKLEEDFREREAQLMSKEWFWANWGFQIDASLVKSASQSQSDLRIPVWILVLVFAR